MSYQDFYQNNKKAALQNWLLLVFLILVSIPSVPGLAGVHPNLAWFGLILCILLIFNTIKSILNLRKERKLLLADPESFIENKQLKNEEDLRPLYWFNRL